MKGQWLLPALLVLGVNAAGSAEPPRVPRFAVHEVALRASGTYSNPYTELSAEAVLTEPEGGRTRTVPLFWDGGSAWTFRFAPDRLGRWTWVVHSRDDGLQGQAGGFETVESDHAGSIRPTTGFPHHFERQDGTPFWFLGDTAWALFTDNAEERHDRDAALRYIATRANQGFNVLHSMLLSEAGWGNRGGLPWEDLAAEKLNPGYWQEVDVRIAAANEQGVVCGLALAWGDKRKVEPFAWRRFPNLAARKRYARYIAARYSAFAVYFLVSGEWHGEVRTRNSTEDALRREFIEIGDALHAADPHGRMIGIHPMTSHGSVREFTTAEWMAFGDYQQNYRQLHERVLQSRAANKPIVNSEYGYFLRDQSGDGVPDKDNSTSLEAMRHATWDIVMAGGYVVTGFGTTYFGGNRDPGPFDLTAAKNKPWEQQIGHVKRLFTGLKWWRLEPHDELVRCVTPRGKDTKELNHTAPPSITYGCLAEPGRQYAIYMRGIEQPITVTLTSPRDALRIRLFNPRTGESQDLGRLPNGDRWDYRPPDRQDWIILLEAADAQ